MELVVCGGSEGGASLVQLVRGRRGAGARGLPQASVGFTNSTEATFPVVGGPDLTQNGSDDAFVARIRQTHFLASP